MIEPVFGILAIVLTVYLVVAPGLALWRQRSLRRENAALKRQVEDLGRDHEELKRRIAGERAPALDEDVPEPEPAEPPAMAEPVLPPERDVFLPPEKPHPVAGPPLERADPGEGRPPPPKPTGPSLEERFASSWMVWLGGVTVALAAVFLFRYAVDQGWLTPLARVVAGLGLGGLVLAGGERTHRYPPAHLPEAAIDYVPPALTAAGIFAIFVSLYAAHGLFGLMGPGQAFVALALTAYAALALSLRQGWFVAALGLLAGYLVPALIETPTPNAVALFVYLFVLTAGALAVMVWRRWWWFAALTLAGALFWPVLWTLESGVRADQLVLSLYALGLAAAYAALSARLPLKMPDTPVWIWLVAIVRESSGLGFTLSGLLIVWLAIVANFNAAAFAAVVAYGAIALALGLWRQSLEGLFAITAIISLGALLIWPQPSDISLPTAVQGVGTASLADAFGPFVMPPEFYAFSRSLWALAALYGIGGYAILGRARTPVVAAGLSALMPVLLFAIGYWRIGRFELDIAWAGWAMALAALMLLAAISVSRRLCAGARDLPPALYAAGCTAAVALAFVCQLREAWLTVAIAAEIAALGWIWSRVRVDALRPIAVILLAVVVVRLVANPLVLTYGGGIAGTFGWVVYGYGLPALACFAAARLFTKDKPDLAVTLCEIAGAGLGFLTVSLQIRLWTAGALDDPDWDLLDIAVQAIWWAIAAALLLRRRFAEPRPWAPVVGEGLLGATVLLVVGGAVLARNPLTTDDPVGTAPVVNLLGLAYLLPAILFGALALGRGLILSNGARTMLLSAAGALVFLWLSLEIRHLFWGTRIGWSPATEPTNGEIYSYSVAWILFALGLLALALWRHAQSLRYASLAVLMVTVAKVFLYDMSDLTGLFRVASFLGLGLTLIGIGRVYSLYVFRTGPGGAGDTPPDQG